MGVVGLKTIPLSPAGERVRGVCCNLPRVSETWAESRADMMKALGDPTRLTMVASLWRAASQLCICDFNASLGITQTNISNHMSHLQETGLVAASTR